MKALDPKLFKENLRHSFSIFVRVERSLRDYYIKIVRVNLEYALEAIFPKFCNLVPVLNDTVLYRVV